MPTEPETVCQALDYTMEGVEILRNYFAHLQPGTDLTEVMPINRVNDPVGGGSCMGKEDLSEPLTGIEALDIAFTNIAGFIQRAKDLIGCEVTDPDE